MSIEYDYPPDEPTREEMEQADADRDPPECICEDTLVEIATVLESCSDCPPAGYPTDKTRCDSCPLREVMA
jgi:hypothetical protein